MLEKIGKIGQVLSRAGGKISSEFGARSRAAIKTMQMEPYGNLDRITRSVLSKEEIAQIAADAKYYHGRGDIQNLLKKENILEGGAMNYAYQSTVKQPPAISGRPESISGRIARSRRGLKSLISVNTKSLKGDDTAVLYHEAGHAVSNFTGTRPANKVASKYVDEVRAWRAAMEVSKLERGSGLLKGEETFAKGTLRTYMFPAKGEIGRYNLKRARMQNAAPAPKTQLPVETQPTILPANLPESTGYDVEKFGSILSKMEGRASKPYNERFFEAKMLKNRPGATIDETADRILGRKFRQDIEADAVRRFEAGELEPVLKRTEEMRALQMEIAAVSPEWQQKMYSDTGQYFMFQPAGKRSMAHIGFPLGMKGERGRILRENRFMSHDTAMAHESGHFLTTGEGKVLPDISRKKLSYGHPHIIKEEIAATVAAKAVINRARSTPLSAMEEGGMLDSYETYYRTHQRWARTEMDVRRSRASNQAGWQKPAPTDPMDVLNTHTNKRAF